MRALILKLVVPLTIISFALITKWWYVLPEDAPDSMFTGFPFPYVGSAWYTSMAMQYFALEFFADLLVYFSFWLLVIWSINRFFKKILLHKIVTIVLWTISALIIALGSLIASNPDNLFLLKRNFKMKVLDSGYNFFWQYVDRSDYNKYHPETKKEK